ncbi:MAG TPA: glycosyltransferase [Candidatus Acidoferrales bacterium]|nr:glycosyltransferase [Candidatus Acidoferrales bacterium]
MKLLLGIPSAGAPARPFLDSLAHLQLPPAVERLERAVITGNYIPAQRDLIVERALECGADLLVMCDDDMVLPPGAIAGLCDALDADPRAAAAGALYYARDGFRPMAVDCWDSRDTRTAVVPGFAHDPVAVDGVGFGCVAIRTHVLRELMPPYFTAHIFIERSAGRVRVCDEDYLFCERLRGAGYRVLLVPSVRCGHYDRQSDSVVPREWETPEATALARMAVINENGHMLLVPAGQNTKESTPEAHVRAELSYVVIP